MTDDFDITPAAQLIDDVLRGDQAAWSAFLERLWPMWTRLVRASPSMGRRRRSDDDVAEVVSRIADKLQRDDHRALRLYLDWQGRNAGKDFADWIRIVAANAVRDHVRRRIAEEEAKEDGASSPIRLLNEYSASPLIERTGVRPPVTAAQTARELLEFARARFPQERWDALALWLDGASFDEVAESLALPGAADARRSVRASVAMLRHHFAGPREEDGLG